MPSITHHIVNKIHKMIPVVEKSALKKEESVSNAEKEPVIMSKNTSKNVTTITL